ncbi:MAG TPA: hypothetical protein VNM37_08585, partial [Candidatus Dormibacteraeota bacterium]|nr:hypothetical protein [Candidatus Dormibacteraeota bacterium]
VLPAGSPQLTFTNQCTINLNPGVTTAQFQVRGPGALTEDNPVQNDPAVVGQSLSLNVFTPCIHITKACANTCTPIGQPISFTGSVTNCGNAPLNGVVVTDNPTAAITFSTTTLLGNAFPAAGGGDLVTGDSVTYSGSYTPSGNLCGPFTDTATVTATNGFVGLPPGITVSDSAQAVCHVSTSPSLTLTKDCFKVSGSTLTPIGGKTLIVGDSYVEVFTVTNNGNVPLSGVTITDVSTNCSGAIRFSTNIVVGNLDIGASVVITNGPFTTSSPNDCNCIGDFATVSGNNICPADTTCPSSATATAGPVTCSLTVNCLPHLSVTKGIACAPGNPGDTCANASDCPTDDAAYGPRATGAKGKNADGTDDCPAFCYKITVLNDGVVDVTNVVLHDTQFGDISIPGTLVVNQSSNVFLKHAWCVDTTNVVFASAVSTGGVSTNSNSAQAEAHVLPLGVQCKLTLTTADGTVLAPNAPNCDLTIGGGGPITLTLVVTNTGLADEDVHLTNLPPLVSCGDNTTPVSSPADFRLVVGGSTTFTLCTVAPCASTTISPQVTGTAVATNAVSCIHDCAGNTITTGSPSTCPATVCCTPPHITVTKGIACAPCSPGDTCANASDCPTDDASYGPRATGAKGKNPDGSDDCPAFCYKITVINDGLVAVTNIVLHDSQFGDIPVPGTLGVGSSNSVFLKHAWCVDTTNTVFASARVGNISTNSNSAQAEAHVLPIGVQCKLTITTADGTVVAPNPSGCDFTTTGGGPVTLTLVVTNTGRADEDVHIGNLPPLVSCTDNSTPANPPADFRLVTGGSTTFTLCTVVPCASTTISPQVTGTAVATNAVSCVCDCAGNKITTGAPSTCPATICCSPPLCITVSKLIACAPANGVAGCGPGLSYGSLATGAAGTNNPAFCYQIIVCNPCTGPTAVTLTNVQVSDPVLAAQGISLAGAFPTTLIPGQCATNFFGASFGLGANRSPSTNVNTVTATGTGPGTATSVGITTNATASATNVVVPLSVSCQLNLTNDFQVNTTGPVDSCDVQLAAGTANAAVQVTLTIHNTGQGDLNVSVVGGSILSTTPLVDCGTGNSATPPVVFVPAGQNVTTNIGCVTVSCPGATVSATVQGSAVASASIPCIFDTAGNVVTTAPSSCQNCVNCATPATPLECRVTGGGTLQPGATD